MPTLRAVAALALLLLAAPGVARGEARTEEEQVFQAAEAAFKDSQYDEAAKLYERTIAINPTRAEAYYKRSLVHFQRKEYRAAVDLLRQGQRVAPSDLTIRSQLGVALYRAGERTAALRLLEEIVAASPQAYQAQLQLGQHYLLVSGDGDKAAAAFEAYFKHRPEDLAQADLQLRPLAGNAYLLARRYPEAQRELELTLKANPEDVLTRVSLAAVFTATGECSKAINLYERLTVEAPRQPSIYYNLGTCYLKVNRRAEAEKNALAYTAQRPSETKGWLLLGDVRHQSRNYAGALAALERARVLDPGNPAVEARIGKVYFAQRSYAQARDVLERARAARPDDVEILTQLAEVYAVTRREDRKVLVGLGEKLARTSNAEALTAAGVAYFVAEEDVLAEKAFTAAIAADPRAYRPKSGLQMTLNHAAGKAVEAGNLKLAEELLGRAQKLDPESVQTNRNLGLVLLLDGRPAEAERALGQARARLGGRDIVINRLLGRAYLALGRRADALRVYQAAEAVAQKIRGPILAQLSTEIGLVHLEDGALDQAIAALETAVQSAGGAHTQQAAQRNLAVAYYRRGTERLSRQPEAAVDDLVKAGLQARGGLGPRENTAIDCALAVAGLRAGKVGLAQDALGRAVRSGGCQLAPPYDRLGMELLTAYAAYRDAIGGKRRDSTARLFARLLPKATGKLADQLRELLRSANELDAYEAFNRGDVKGATASLKVAQRMQGRGDHRVLEHNLAVLDLAAGRLPAAQRTLEQLGQKPPEALLNLGIARDLQGDQRRALELYRRAQERGVKAPRLKEWIDVKERLLGGGER